VSDIVERSGTTSFMHPTTTQLVQEFSPEGSTAVEWARADRELTAAGIYWITTVRPDGRPHVTPLIGVYDEHGFCFCTGPGEQKAVNLAADPRCLVLTGSNRYDGGLDVVIEGRARRIDDDHRLRQLADAWVAKYGDDWRFEVADGAFRHEQGGQALVFTIDADKALGFDRDGGGSQTRWKF
jgi:hypothetical protein